MGRYLLASYVPSLTLDRVLSETIVRHIVWSKAILTDIGHRLCCLSDGCRFAIRTDNADGVDSTGDGGHRNKHLSAQRLDETSSTRRQESVSATTLDVLLVAVQLSAVRRKGSGTHRDRGGTGGSGVSTARLRSYGVAGFRWTAGIAAWYWEGRLAKTCQGCRPTVLLGVLSDQRWQPDDYVHPHPQRKVGGPWRPPAELSLECPGYKNIAACFINVGLT